MVWKLHETIGLFVGRRTKKGVRHLHIIEKTSLGQQNYYIYKFKNICLLYFKKLYVS